MQKNQTVIAMEIDSVDYVVACEGNEPKKIIVGEEELDLSCLDYIS